MKESEYVTQIITEINSNGGKAVKFVETEFSEIGTPDIIGCFNGHCFVLEAKIYPNAASGIQALRLKEWEKAGAVALIVGYPDIFPKDIVNFLKALG